MRLTDPLLTRALCALLVLSGIHAHGANPPIVEVTLDATDGTIVEVDDEKYLFYSSTDVSNGELSLGFTATLTPAHTDDSKRHAKRLCEGDAGAC